MNKLLPPILVLVTLSYATAETPLKLNVRRRVPTAPNSPRAHTLTKAEQWAPSKTAIVICDMWDDHYCLSAAKRVAEMAPRMNEVIKRARDQGVLIIHCPSGCMKVYAGTPPRKLAQQAPKVKTKIPLKGWCYLDTKHESGLPIDDKKESCDDLKPRKAIRFFNKQIDALEIKPGDAITDSAEAYYLMRQRGITNVIVMGVHTNMCVLGRPFGIRQMVYQGQNVVLMRDMTDSMYNPRLRPKVSHFTGTDLVINHIERHWCGTITSADFLGDKPFRFKQDHRKHLVIVMAESEYKTNESLPEFALRELGHDYRVSLVFDDTQNGNHLPGLEVLNTADVALLSIRRRTLTDKQFAVIRRYVDSGKPLVAIRTSSHAFCLRKQKPPAGHQEWRDFDRQVLGGYYQNHHGNKLVARVTPLKSALSHPIMKGISPESFDVKSSLYLSDPLAKTTTPLLTGKVDGAKAEPVAWTNIRNGGGRVFYTSLGHVGDFKIPAFRKLLKNGIAWAVGQPTETSTPASGGCCN